MFVEFENKAKALIESCPEWESKNPQLTYNCYNKRTGQRNTRYDVGNSDETRFDHSTQFRVTIVYAVLDQITTELDSRVEAYVNVYQPFDFLFNLESLSVAEIREGAENLRTIYSTDLDKEFSDECVHFEYFMNDINAEIENDKNHYIVPSDSDSDFEYEDLKPKKSKKLTSKCFST